MCDSEEWNLLFYNSFGDGKQHFNRKETKLRSISSVLTSTYMCVKLKEIDNNGPDLADNRDLNEMIDNAESVLRELHRFIFAIPNSSKDKSDGEKLLIPESIGWTCRKNNLCKPEEGPKIIKPAKNAQYRSFAINVRDDRPMPSMSYIFEHGIMPIEVKGRFISQFLDEKKDYFEHSIVGKVLDAIKKHSMRNLKDHLDPRYESIIDEISKIIFVISLAQESKGTLYVDFSYNSIETRFKTILEFIHESRYTYDIDKKAIETITYDPEKGRSVCNQDEYLCSLLWFVPKTDSEIWQENGDDQIKHGYDSDITPIPPNSSLRALVAAQHEESSTIRHSRFPDYSPETYVDIKAHKNKLLSTYVFDALINKESVLVYGSAGMGKTTLSNMIYLRMYTEFMNDVSKAAPIIVSPELFSEINATTWDNKANATRTILQTLIGRYPHLGEINISQRADVVFFVDGVDEYFRFGMLEIYKIIGISKVCPTLVTGRTDVLIKHSLDFKHCVNLKESVEFERFKRIFENYTGHESAISIESRDVKEQRLTPLLAALMATDPEAEDSIILNSSPLLKALMETHSTANFDGRPCSGIFLNELIVLQTMTDKMNTINNQGFSLRPYDVKRLIQEYAWQRYIAPVENCGERINVISKKTDYPKDFVYKWVDEFTEATFPNDRKFLYTSVQDYLVSCWILDRIGSNNFYEDMFKVVFRAPVNSFLKELISLVPDMARRMAHWCEMMYNHVNEIEDRSKRCNYQVKIHLLMLSTLIGNDNATRYIVRRNAEIMRDNDKNSPQYVVALISAI